MSAVLTFVGSASVSCAIVAAVCLAVTRRAERRVRKLGALALWAGTHHLVITDKGTGLPVLDAPLSWLRDIDPDVTNLRDPKGLRVRILPADPEARAAVDTPD